MVVRRTDPYTTIPEVGCRPCCAGRSGNVVLADFLSRTQISNLQSEVALLKSQLAIDRVVHHSVILELNVSSYRMESAKKKQQRTTK